MSALFRWPCSISIPLSPTVLSLVVSALFRWPWSISILLSSRSVTAGVRPFPRAMQHLFICLPGLSLVVSAPFPLAMQKLLICLAGLSLVVSALFRCISIHLSPRSVAGDVRPFPLGWPVAFLVICLPGLSPLACSISIHLSPRSVAAGVRLFPLAM